MNPRGAGVDTVVYLFFSAWLSYELDESTCMLHRRTPSEPKMAAAKTPMAVKRDCSCSPVFPDEPCEVCTCVARGPVASFMDDFTPTVSIEFTKPESTWFTCESPRRARSMNTAATANAATTNTMRATTIATSNACSYRSWSAMGGLVGPSSMKNRTASGYSTQANTLS